MNRRTVDYHHTSHTKVITSEMSTLHTNPTNLQTLTMTSEGEAKLALAHVAEETRKRINLVEKAIDKEERRSTVLHNDLSVMRSSVRELEDSIDKSKKRENELTKQVEVWGRMVQKHKEKIFHNNLRESSLHREGIELCEDIERNLQLLKRKQKNVDEKIAELERIKEFHTEKLRLMKEDIKKLKEEMKLWSIRKESNNSSINRLKTKKEKWEKELAEKNIRMKEIEEVIRKWKTSISILITTREVEKEQREQKIQIASGIHSIHPPNRAIPVDLTPKIVYENETVQMGMYTIPTSRTISVETISYTSFTEEIELKGEEKHHYPLQSVPSMEPIGYYERNMNETDCNLGNEGVVNDHFSLRYSIPANPQRNRSEENETQSHKDKHWNTEGCEERKRRENRREIVTESVLSFEENYEEKNTYTEDAKVIADRLATEIMRNQICRK